MLYSQNWLEIFWQNRGQKEAICSNQYFLGECGTLYENLFSRKALTLIQYGFWSEEERDCYPGLWETGGADMGCAPFGRAGTGSWWILSLWLSYIPIGNAKILSLRQILLGSNHSKNLLSSCKQQKTHLKHRWLVGWLALSAARRAHGQRWALAPCLTAQGGPAPPSDQHLETRASRCVDLLAARTVQGWFCTRGIISLESIYLPFPFSNTKSWQILSLWRNFLEISFSCLLQDKVLL